MRISFFPPTADQFKSLFQHAPPPPHHGFKNRDRLGGGLSDITIFTPYSRGRGGGPLGRRRGGGIFSNIAKRILPFLFRTIKPSVQSFGKNMIQDVIVNKKNIKESLKRRGKESLKDAGKRLLMSTMAPRGGGCRKKRKRAPSRHNPPKKKRKKKKSSSHSGAIKDVYNLID